MRNHISFVYFAFLIGSISAALRPRIIGGVDAIVRDFPYQASIRVRGHLVCGAVIISKTHVLTAAHCFSTDTNVDMVPPYNYLTIHTGTSSSREFGYLHRMAKLLVHPGWAQGAPNDIAVVKLAGQIVFNEWQQMVGLPNRDVVSGSKGYLTGWGYTTAASDAVTSVQLQKLKMTLLANSVCQTQLSIKLHADEMCAYHSRGHGFCTGDSGGPLVVDNKVVGIASWVHKGNYGCGIPEVFTNVYTHLNFIVTAMSF